MKKSSVFGRERKRGLRSSMRTIGPMSCKGPSNCTKLGAASTMNPTVIVKISRKLAEGLAEKLFDHADLWDKDILRCLS